MPNIYRFLIKTLCVFGVTCFLLKTNANAFDGWCHCTAFNKCSLQNDPDSSFYSHAQICKSKFPGVTFYCDAIHQRDFVEDINKLFCQDDKKYVDSGTDCGCQNPWKIKSDTLDEDANCFGAYICPGVPVHSIPSVWPIPTGYKIGTECIESTGITYADIVTYSCDTSKKYYATGDTITCNVGLFYNSECNNKVTGLTVSDCTGCSTEPCNDTSKEWKNCSDSGMNCFGSVTPCAPGEADGTNGCYDPNLYDRQVGYTFNASANDGNGSCTWQIKDDGWRCKKGYYPTDIKTYAESDLQREPNFRCKPCPIGYISAEYDAKTQGWLHDTSRDYDLGASSGDRHSCQKCPNAFTTDKPEPEKGLIIDSVQKCYIDPNIKLSDELGSIYLYEEIGIGTQLYYQ